jgi:DNA-binding LacI/PurR family transcriptional regulator
LQDIADEAGVSSALVSMVLRGRPGASAATAARVVEVAERLRYRANRTASHLASPRTRLIGITMTPGNPYHAELIEEIQAITDARGYDVLLSTVTRTHDERRAIEILVDSSCEALVLLGPVLPPEMLVKAVDGVPTVCIGRPLDQPCVDVVRSADIEAMEILVDHLAALGHTGIAHVDGGDRYLPAERVRGYRQAMRTRGLDPLVLPGGETREAGIRAVADIVEHPDITAVVAYNDQCAIGILDQLHRDGFQVPQDVSVTGFDDDRVADLSQLSLTTINPSQLLQARLAIETAIERAEGSRAERIVRVAAVRLVVRGSTAPPRQPARGWRRTMSRSSP